MGKFGVIAFINVYVLMDNMIQGRVVRVFRLVSAIKSIIH